MATRSGTPARIRLRAAVRLQIVEQAMRHLRFPARIAQRRAPLSHRNAVAMKHVRFTAAAPPLSPLKYLP